MPPCPRWPRVRDQGQHGQQAGDFPGPVPDHAGHGGNSGMRHWTGGLSVRADMDSTPVIKPDGRPPPRISAGPSGQLAATHPDVKSGTYALVATLRQITPTRRSRGSGAGSNRQPSAFQVNRAERCADLRKRTSPTSETALGGRCTNKVRQSITAQQGTSIYPDTGSCSRPRRLSLLKQVPDVQVPLAGLAWDACSVLSGDVVTAEDAEQVVQPRLGAEFLDGFHIRRDPLGLVDEGLMREQKHRVNLDCGGRVGERPRADSGVSPGNSSPCSTRSSMRSHLFGLWARALALVSTHSSSLAVDSTVPSSGSISMA